MEAQLNQILTERTSTIPRFWPNARNADETMET
jgi:hypothetical protein